MDITAMYGECLLRQMERGAVVLELLRVSDTIRRGAVAYAPQGADEPGIPALLAKYQQNCQYPKLHCINP